MAEDFINIEFKMPEVIIMPRSDLLSFLVTNQVTDILTDISSLIDNDIEEKVENNTLKHS